MIKHPFQPNNITRIVNYICIRFPHPVYIVARVCVISHKHAGNSTITYLCHAFIYLFNSSCLAPCAYFWCKIWDTPHPMFVSCFWLHVAWYHRQSFQEMFHFSRPPYTLYTSFSTTCLHYSSFIVIFLQLWRIPPWLGDLSAGCYFPCIQIPDWIYMPFCFPVFPVFF